MISMGNIMLGKEAANMKLLSRFERFRTLIISWCRIEEVTDYDITA